MGANAAGKGAPRATRSGKTAQGIRRWQFCQIAALQAFTGTQSLPRADEEDQDNITLSHHGRLQLIAMARDTPLPERQAVIRL